MSIRLQDLQQAIEDYAARLLLVPDHERNEPRAGEGWTPQEVLGHLIDSAANNHARFVRAQLADDLVFPTYDQDRWVSAQHYREETWYNLVQLWRRYNLHLLHLLSFVPEEVLVRPRAHHNLDQIGWQKVSAQEPVTLEYLVEDYYGHMREHLGQILKT